MVSIIGAGTTRFGRHPDADIRSLAEAATRTALDDAGLSPCDVQMVVFGNAVDGVLHGQEMVRGEVALRHAGFLGVPVLNVENACASSSSAFYVACLAVRAGAADVALAIGVETHPSGEGAELRRGGYRHRPGGRTGAASGGGGNTSRR